MALDQRQFSSRQRTRCLRVLSPPVRPGKSRAKVAIGFTLVLLTVSFQTVSAYPPNEITGLSVYPTDTTLGESTSIRGSIEIGNR